MLGFQVKVTTCCGAGMPVPLSAVLAGRFAAAPEMTSAPEAVPDACGVKRTFTDAVLPAAMVRGNAAPLIENSGPLIVADSTVTGPLLAVRVAVKV